MHIQIIFIGNNIPENNSEAPLLVLAKSIYYLFYAGWVSDNAEIVFQLVVEFDFFMCKFFSGAFGSAVASLF